MQRVHQMILAEVGSTGLEAARRSLKKTEVTTVVKGNGTRTAVTRDDDGVEHEEVVSRRQVDIAYLHGSSVSDNERAAASRTASESQVKPLAPSPKRCDEDILDATPAPRFDADDPAVLDHLTEHGFAIVKDVASPLARSEAEELLWHFLRDNAGFDRKDPSTWSDVNFERIGCVGTGIIDGSGIGQSDFMWHLRSLPHVRQAFAHIWNTEELLVSFDAASVFRPWRQEQLNLSRTHGGWYHLDQGRGLKGFECVQGLVTLLDVDASTGGLVVIPGSHNKFEEIVRHQYTDDNYVSIPAVDPILELPKKLVTCKAGDLVLWDSRCIHCNAPGRFVHGSVVEDDAPPSLLRMVGYVCMTPKAKASSDTLQKRLDAYQRSLTTSHWPHLFSPVRAGKQLKTGVSRSLPTEGQEFRERADLIA